MLLIKFRWSDAARVRIIANVAEGSMELFQAIAEDEGHAYLTAPPHGNRWAIAAALCRAFESDIPEARAIVLESLMVLRGASAATHAPYRYVVETDVLPEHEADFNRWYDEEHLPGLAGVPGTVQAMRLRDSAGSPRYYACYDLATTEAFGSPPWLAVRATPWSARVRPAFRNTRRTMFRSSRP